MINYLKKMKRQIKFQVRLSNEMGGGTGTEVNLLLLAHALEKGMGLPSPRPKFGYEKAVRLLELLEGYKAQGYYTQRYAFIESVSVLGAYLSFTDNDVGSLLGKYKKINVI